MSTKEADGHLLKIDSEYSGERIDKFLSNNLKDVSRNRIQRLITEGKILVNGAQVSKHHRLISGAEIKITDLSSKNQGMNINAEVKPLRDLNVSYGDVAFITNL